MWEVFFQYDFRSEFLKLPESVRDEIVALSALLEKLGPHLGRPRADTLKGSVFPNMKELRFDAEGGVWRVAFAFDPKRRAILLVGGDKSGTSERRFYRALIAKADERLEAHLIQLKQDKYMEDR